MTVEHHGVTRIVATLVSYHHIGATCEIISDFPFSFVSPLGSDHY